MISVAFGILLAMGPRLAHFFFGSVAIFFRFWQRDFVLKRLSEMPDLVTAVPQGAFYVFPDVSSHFGKSAPDGTVIGGATDLCLYLLRCVARSSFVGGCFLS